MGSAPPRAETSNTNDEWFTAKDFAPILHEFSVLYCWKARAKAYDLYKEAAYRHKRFRRQNSVEERHYNLATRLLRELETKVFDDPKFFIDMDPKVALDLFNKLVGIQRVSVGLPASGPLPQKEQTEESSFEMILRSLSRKANIQDVGSGRTVDGQSEVLSKVLEDEGSTANLQEVIIKITKASQRHEEGLEGGRRFKGRGRTTEGIRGEDLEAYDVNGAPGAHE